MTLHSRKSVIALLAAVLCAGLMSGCTTLKPAQNSQLQQNSSSDAGDEHILWGRY